MSALLSCRGLRAALPLASRSNPSSKVKNGVLVNFEAARGITDIEYYKEVDQSHLHIKEAQSSMRKFQLKLRALSAMEERRTKRKLAEKRESGAQGSLKAEAKVTRVAGVTALPFEEENPFVLEEMRQEEAEAVAGKYVERDSTTMLRLIADNVPSNPKNPDYRVSDDPYLMPYSYGEKRRYIGAKESGRKAARFVLDSYPELFNKNKIEVEPKIPAFLPRLTNVGDDATIGDLETFIATFRVEEASSAYETLEAKGEDIPQEVKQNLLELLAYSNGLPEVDEDMKIAVGSISKGDPKLDLVWGGKEGALADRIFASMEEKTPEARMAMALGLSKYRGEKEANKTFVDLMNEDVKLNVEFYNAAIKSTDHWDKAIKITEKMKKDGVQPNGETYVKLIFKASRIRYKNASPIILGLLREIKASGLPVPLEAYRLALLYHHFNQFYLKFVDADKEGKSNRRFVHFLVEELEGRGDLADQVTAEMDSHLLSSMMKAAYEINDLDLGYKIQELLHTGDNERLNSHITAELTYYNHFFDLIEANESLDIVVDFIGWYVPNRFYLQSKFMLKVLDKVKEQEALKYLPYLWSTITLLGDGYRSTDLMEVWRNALTIATTVPMDDTVPNLKETYLTMVNNILESVDKPYTSYFTNNGPAFFAVLDLALSLALQEGDTDLARRVFEYCLEKEEEATGGTLNAATLESYVDKAASNPACRQSLIDCILYGAKISAKGLDEIALNVIKAIDVTEEENDLINKAVTGVLGTGWQEKDAAAAN